jgi:predicted transcriptional regulator
MTKTVITANVDQTIQSVCKTMHGNHKGSSVVIVKREIDGYIPFGNTTENDIIHKIGSLELYSPDSNKSING